MSDKVKVELGEIQKTLFMTLAARARQNSLKRPVLRDQKAAEILEAVDFDAAKYGQGWGGAIMVVRTAIVDSWVLAFLAEHPAGTVIELGTGLNTRFDRVDNGQVHWIDLDLPDTIELRRNFFVDSERRRMIAASVLDEDWFSAVSACPEPYFFAIEGVLAYLEQAPEVIARIAAAFPGALLAFDTYSSQMTRMQHQRAAKLGVAALWEWSCDDPRSLESLGLEVVEAAAVNRPPPAMRAQLPIRFRYLLPMVRRVTGDISNVTLFRSRPG
ncbi:MAG TPA: class I SAM-dependent methyltransferase [Streptosporangiaceae bacterium]